MNLLCFICGALSVGCSTYYILDKFYNVEKKDNGGK